MSARRFKLFTSIPLSLSCTLETATEVQSPTPLAPGCVCAVHVAPLSVETQSWPPSSAARRKDPSPLEETLLQFFLPVKVAVQEAPPSVDW